MFIETITYRMADHTTADDARRYRDQGELEKWAPRDPILRLGKYLAGKGLWDEGKETALQERVKARVSEIVRNAEGIETPTKADIFDYTFAGGENVELSRQKSTMRTGSLGQKPGQETLRSC